MQMHKLKLGELTHDKTENTQETNANGTKI